MKKIYHDIRTSISKGEKLLAVLVDPDKMKLAELESFMSKLNTSIATHIFVGGSTVNEDATDLLVDVMKNLTTLPIVLFPGDTSQITKNADALLFLSLISGRNADYLIGKHVLSISKIKTTDLEIISTGYVLVESGKETAVERVTQTKPISREQTQVIVDTCVAGELLGMKLIYLEAGSGAKHPISSTIIAEVKQHISVPLIVGGGIRTASQLEDAYAAGADLVVMGTAFEEDESFFTTLA